MKLRIEAFFIRYQWYRDWQAGRSRKRLEKKNALPIVKGVESFQVSDSVMERENARRQTMLDNRARVEKEQKEVDDFELKARLDVLLSLYPGKPRSELTTEELKKVEDQIYLVMDAFYNGRNAKKS